MGRAGIGLIFAFGFLWFPVETIIGIRNFLYIPIERARYYNDNSLSQIYTDFASLDRYTLLCVGVVYVLAKQT